MHVNTSHHSNLQKRSKTIKLQQTNQLNKNMHVQENKESN
jgi:hypothetical protein